jgi:hypothetical protein
MNLSIKYLGVNITNQQNTAMKRLEQYNVNRERLRSVAVNRGLNNAFNQTIKDINSVRKYIK